MLYRLTVATKESHACRSHMTHHVLSSHLSSVSLSVLSSESWTHFNSDFCIKHRSWSISARKKKIFGHIYFIQTVSHIITAIVFDSNRFCSHRHVISIRNTTLYDQRKIHIDFCSVHSHSKLVIVEQHFDGQNYNLEFLKNRISNLMIKLFNSQ